MAKPILYSFRRCPYAMRARMALIESGTDVEHREILLKDKPPQFLAASPKGTIPVLVLDDGTVLEQSLEIMHWALQRNDPEGWLNDSNADHAAILIDSCDGAFKQALDCYKYADRYPEPASSYRDQAMPFLDSLEQRLENNRWLTGERMSIADIAVFPFIRQFAAVDREWFETGTGPNLVRWLDTLLDWALFKQAMKKHPLWDYASQ